MSTEEEPEIQTLYLEGSTAPGAPKGKRFPTDSGNLNSSRMSLKISFQPTAKRLTRILWGQREPY